MESGGFSNGLPMDARLFAAGDGDVIEEAPTGYYRFHFWKTDETGKEHDNWAGIVKGVGPICVSVLRVSESGSGGEEDSGPYYRLLIRTSFVLITI